MEPWKTNRDLWKTMKTNLLTWSCSNIYIIATTSTDWPSTSSSPIIMTTSTGWPPRKVDPAFKLNISRSPLKRPPGLQLRSMRSFFIPGKIKNYPMMNIFLFTTLILSVGTLLLLILAAYLVFSLASLLWHFGTGSIGWAQKIFCVFVWLSIFLFALHIVLFFRLGNSATPWNKSLVAKRNVGQLMCNLQWILIENVLVFPC